MRSLEKILGKAREKEGVTEASPPVIGAERAERRRYEEAKEKKEIISDYRTKIDKRK